MRHRIAVIGGGISGLAAAHQLASRSRVDVLLLEANDRLGGVLQTVERSGFLVEAAADNFLTHPTTVVDLCRNVGLENSLISPDAKRRQAFVLHKGALQTIPAGFLVMAPSRIRPMLATPLLSVRGKLRLALEYFIPRNSSEQDESLASFVRRRFGRETFERLVQPLVGSIYGADLERLSITAAMPRFRDMERRHGSLIRAMLRQQRDQARENGAGARYGQFAALRNGMTSLVDALSKCLPPHAIQLTSPVDRLVRLEDAGWLLSIGGTQPRQQKVDAIILATPAYHTANLVKRIDFMLSNYLSRIEYASCAVISLGYRRSQVEHPLNGFGFVVPLIEQRNILSCGFASIKYEGRAPEDSVLLKVYVGGACQDGFLRLSNPWLVEMAKHELRDVLGIQGEPVLCHVARHIRGMAQYHVGHLDLVARINRRLERFQSLAVAGSAYGGVGVPACIQSGQAAANQILNSLNTSVSAARRCGDKTEALV